MRRDVPSGKTRHELHSPAAAVGCLELDLWARKPSENSNSNGPEQRPVGRVTRANLVLTGFLTLSPCRAPTTTLYTSWHGNGPVGFLFVLVIENPLVEISFRSRHGLLIAFESISDFSLSLCPSLAEGRVI